jgi:hypothetical protein
MSIYTCPSCLSISYSCISSFYKEGRQEKPSLLIVSARLFVSFRFFRVEANSFLKYCD